MGRRHTAFFFLLLLFFGGISGLAAHRFVPERLLASVLVGSVFGAALYVWLILLKWRECKGDGTCLNCPKSSRMSRLQRFCGNHPRITWAQRLVFVLMGICLAGAGYIFGHIIVGIVGAGVLEMLTQLKLFLTKLLNVLR